MRLAPFLLLTLSVLALPVVAQPAALRFQAEASADADAGDEDDGDDGDGDARTSAAAPVPAWLPRAAFLGAFYNEDALTPQVRVQWQFTLVQMPNDALVGFIEGGGGYGLSLPSDLRSVGGFGGMTYFYQHLALIGLGYDAVYRSGWTWGFQVLTGAQFYGARFQLYESTNAVGGTVEGRGHLGFVAGPVRISLSAGWAQLWVVPRTSLAAQLTGGPLFGLYVNWRPVTRGNVIRR